MCIVVYLDAGQVPVISEEHLRALQILTYSDNEELQRSAALCFVEISERSTNVALNSSSFSYNYFVKRSLKVLGVFHC